jgi:hypothetical protein
MPTGERHDERQTGSEDECLHSAVEVAVAAPVEDERPLVAEDPELLHQADDDEVVAGVVLVPDRAVDVGERVVEDGRAARRRSPADAAEPVGALGREPRQTSSWCSLRMLTVNLPAASIFGHVDESFDAQNSTSGGSSDTDENEFADTPMGSFSSIAVMIVTPVAKWPRTVR